MSVSKLEVSHPRKCFAFVIHWLLTAMLAAALPNAGRLNAGEFPAKLPPKINFNKPGCIGLSGTRHVRDLWRQTDLPDPKGALKLTIQPHGVILLKMSPFISAEQKNN